MKIKKSIYMLIIINVIGLMIIGISFGADLIPRKSSKEAEKHLFPIVLESGKWTYMNSEGRIVMKRKFDYAGPFSEGLAAVSINGKPGYINKNGKFVIKSQLVSGGLFKCGRAIVRKGESEGFIDKKGKLIIKPQYAIAQDFSEGLALMLIRKKGFIPKIVFIDKRGKIKLDLSKKKYNTQLFCNFSEGLLPVEVDNKWGFIDKKGKIVIKPKYDGAQSFSDGLAAVSIKGQWGYINKKQEFVIQPTYIATNGFSEGIAIVCSNMYSNKTDELKYNLNELLKSQVFKIYQCAAIDKKGNILFKINNDIYNDYAKFSNGLCRFTSTEESYIDSNTTEEKTRDEYIDKNGRSIYKCKCEYKVKNGRVISN